MWGEINNKDNNYMDKSMSRFMKQIIVFKRTLLNLNFSHILMQTAFA